MAIIRNTLLVVACCLCASAIAECSADAQHEARFVTAILLRVQSIQPKLLEAFMSIVYV